MIFNIGDSVKFKTCNNSIGPTLCKDCRNCIADVYKCLDDHGYAHGIIEELPDFLDTEYRIRVRKRSPRRTNKNLDASNTVLIYENLLEKSELTLKVEDTPKQIFNPFNI